MRPLRTVLGTLILLGGMAGVPSLSAQASLRSEVDTTLVTVGDRIQLTITVTHDAAVRVEWPDSIVVTPFEVLDARLLPPQSGENGTRSTAVISLAAFELGELEIPSFEVGVVTVDGSRETLDTDRFAIEVTSVGADESGDIREIRGPMGIPVGAVQIFFRLLVAILILAVGFFLFRRFRSRGVESTPAPTAPPRPAHEVALEALAALEASPLLVEGRIKDYHIAVSEIVRRYIEDRFHVDALEMTTSELMTGMRRVGVEGPVLESLGRFLERCDMVKFAKVRPPADEARATLWMARDFVEQSRPLTVAPADPAPERNTPDDGPPVDARRVAGTPADTTPATPDAPAKDRPDPQVGGTVVNDTVVEETVAKETVAKDTAVGGPVEAQMATPPNEERP